METPAPAHREHDVADGVALELATQAFAAAPELGVDLETNAMHVYRGRLCFVQVATEADIFVLDTLAPGVDAKALAPVLWDPACRKVFHDAQGDLRVLARDGLRAAGIFDTHRAATLLGLPRVGLGDLVQERFGVRLKKEHQTSDFGRRPLPAEIRAYVADDVRYLLPLARVLEADARAKDVLEELQLEFERIAAEGVVPESPPRPKLPGNARTPLHLAVAEAVDAIRHQEAEARDLPVGRVLPNASVGEIAARLPKTREALAKIPGVKGSFLRSRGEEVLAALARLFAASERGELPPAPPAERRDPRRREREERLKALRAAAAKERGVTPSIVLPTSVVGELATRAPRDLEELVAVPYLGEKRVRLYGERILAALHG